MGRRKRNRKPRAVQLTTSGAAGGSSAGAVTPSDRLRPWLLGGMCALFVARPLFPSEAAARQGDGLPVVMLWIMLAVFWLLRAIGRPQFRVRFGWTDGAVILLIGWHTVAAVWAAFRVSPRPAVNMLWEWIGLGLAFFLARQLVTGRREARAVIAVMVALAVALSGYGLYQYFYELPATRELYAADPERAMREAGLWFEPGSPERQLFESRLQSTEPIATFALTNSLAGYLAPWLLVLAGIAISSGLSRQRLSTWTAGLCCGLPIAGCLVLTKSRSGYVAAALGFVLVWLLCRERKKRFGWKLPAGVALLGAILTAAAVVSGRLDRQVFSEASKSLGYRVQYWQSTLGMIADHPLAGCGPGNFQPAYTRYKLPEASEEVADPHNFLLEVWATAGTPAMLALLAVLGCFACASIRNLQFTTCNLQSPKPPDSSPVPEGEETIDSPAYVFAGAVCGFLLALPLALISAASPGLPAVLIGLPLAAGCVVLLSRWIYLGRMPVLLPAIGVVVLLVNLLAAGGIGFPGVAGSFWLLLALGLNRTEADQPPQTLPRTAAFGALVVALGSALTCYISAYGPVLRCQRMMQAARGNPARMEQCLHAAAKADPLASRPWQQLASTVGAAWREDPTPKRFAQFERYNAMALKLAPNSSLAWLTSGDWYLEAFLKARREDDMPEAVKSSYGKEAIRSYTQAVEMYPNSALYRAKLALAYKAADNQVAFRREAHAALRLDEKTPHADKKLTGQLRRQLLLKEGGA